ncbi:hypothetical protein MM213_19195 [Belliella sp. R4-6]|uniref:Uncharacterized protein n=1 Tax=Belliella alkalica TaxID=1730871 RepID=A0ABS9VGR6_9BACT|nr:hypothetical protein [Belliella alkalica]MCH7415636.1 hypothetical protein [Belliella alkalica]
MNANYLKILIPLWSLGIIAFIILSPTELKILPMLAVIFMATGINYSLFKYLKAFPSEKSNLYYMNPFNQFEKTVKIAKPLRLV